MSHKPASVQQNAPCSSRFGGQRPVRTTGVVDDEITWWPDDGPATVGELGIVSINYNTAHLISLLIWSIHRFLAKLEFVHVRY